MSLTANRSEVTWSVNTSPHRAHFAHADIFSRVAQGPETVRHASFVSAQKTHHSRGSCRMHSHCGLIFHPFFFLRTFSLAINFCCDLCLSLCFASWCTESMRSCCANAPSDPISNTSPVAPVTVPDTDTASDRVAVAEQSLVALLRKQDGTEMFVTGGCAERPCQERSGYRRHERGGGPGASFSGQFQLRPTLDST